MLCEVLVFLPWYIFPAGRGRGKCPDGPGELVQSSALCLLTAHRSLNPLAASPPSSSSLFCHFAPLLVEIKTVKVSSEVSNFFLIFIFITHFEHPSKIKCMETAPVKSDDDEHSRII